MRGRKYYFSKSLCCYCVVEISLELNIVSHAACRGATIEKA